MPAAGPGPYNGYDSLTEAIDALRCGRFRILRALQLEGRGVVLEGKLIEGAVRSGMVLIPYHRDHDNLYVELDVKSVEYIRQPGGTDNVGVVLGTAAIVQEANLTEGRVVEVLERSPAA